MIKSRELVEALRREGGKVIWDEDNATIFAYGQASTLDQVNARCYYTEPFLLQQIALARTEGLNEAKEAAAKKLEAERDNIIPANFTMTEYTEGRKSGLHQSVQIVRTLTPDPK